MDVETFSTVEFKLSASRKTSPPIEEISLHVGELGGISRWYWPKEIRELGLGGMGALWANGVEALWTLGDPGGVGVITDGRCDRISNSSTLLILSEIDFFSFLRQHCPSVAPANWFDRTSLSILAVAWLRLNIERKSESVQLLLVDSKPRFLPVEVPFDMLRSATLNPYSSPVTISKLWAQSAVEWIKSLISQTILSFFNSFGIFFRYLYLQVISLM